MKIFDLNHVALHVRNLEVSERFYRTALRLEAIPRPAFSFAGAWFRLGARQELHLIAEEPELASALDHRNHFALQTDDLNGWERHFRALGIPHRPRNLRPDGAEQLFVADPDGHWIELCVLPSGGASSK